MTPANILLYPNDLKLDDGRQATVWTACYVSKYIVTQSDAPETAVQRLVEWLDTRKATPTPDGGDPFAEYQDTPDDLVSRFNSGHPWNGSAPEDVVVRVD